MIDEGQLITVDQPERLGTEAAIHQIVALAQKSSLKSEDKRAKFLAAVAESTIRIRHAVEEKNLAFDATEESNFIRAKYIECEGTDREFCFKLMGTFQQAEYFEIDEKQHNPALFLLIVIAIGVAITAAVQRFYPESIGETPTPPTPTQQR